LPDASALVVDAVVINGRALRLSIPNCDRPFALRRPEHHFPDGVTDQVGNAAPRAGGGLAQRVELFFAEVDLRLFHGCHFMSGTAIRQSARAKTPPHHAVKQGPVMRQRGESSADTRSTPSVL